MSIQSATIVNRAVGIQFNCEKFISFEDCWLRDNCRCSACYHADTYQRANHILNQPDSKIIKLENHKTKLYILWDDDHESYYEASFLSQFGYVEWTCGNKLRHSIWSGEDNIAQRVARVQAKDFLNSDGEAKIVFQSLIQYGVALLEGVEASVEATEKVCKALGGVQHTLFGGMWEFTTRADHADTAYTNLPLALHNDSTYFTESTGLQILHCLKHENGTGGETILADGFHGANKLRAENPEDFHFLTKYNLEAEYIEKDRHHKHAAPVIKVEDKTGDIEQIRFNVYDRSPMAFANAEECRSYYRSLRNLARHYEDPRNQWQFKLVPGLVLVIDNFRVLHGRTAFTGNRVLCGSYVARSDWLDRARTHNLIQ